MKKLGKVFLTAVIVAFGYSLKAQDSKMNQMDQMNKMDQDQDTISQSDVPEKVVQSFYQEFASAEDAQWEKEGKDYVAEFTQDDEEKEATFSSSGEVNKVMTTITEEDLPAAVQKTLKNNYSGYEYKDISRIEKQGKTSYMVNVEKEGQTQELKFDASGKVIEGDKNSENKSGTGKSKNSKG